MTPIPKNPKIVSLAIRQAARGEDCCLRGPTCNHDPATTVLAHIRMAGHSGVGQKPLDIHAVFACSSCHAAMDGRVGLITEHDILRGMMETQRKLVALDLIKVG